MIHLEICSILNGVNTMKRKKIFIFIILFLLLWFFAIDVSLYVEQCNDCLLQRTSKELRIFTIPVYKNIQNHQSIAGYIANELGIPCEHKHFTREHRKRWWGLIICTRPCIQGIYVLTNGDISDYKILSNKIKSASNDNTKLKEVFKRRVLIDHDRNYLKRFVEELENDELKKIAIKSGNLTDNEIKDIVERIENIEWIVLEFDDSQIDQIAEEVLILGKSAAPYLVEKIESKKHSMWMSWATEGDIACIMLSLIYKEYWPNQEFRDEFNLDRFDNYYSFYIKALKNKNENEKDEVRKRLKNEWLKIIEGNTMDSHLL
jgi:hypothetical protein